MGIYRIQVYFARTFIRNEQVKKLANIAIVFCFAFIALALIDVPAFIENSRRGVLLFGTNVLPVLFPFFLISSLLIELGLFRMFRPPAAVFLLSFLSGYPTGAQMLSQLYQRGEISRNDAIKTATYTSAASPIFVIATLGTCFYASTKLGIIIFTATALGALVNGLFYRRIKFKNTPATPPKILKTHTDYNLPESISKALYASIQNTLAVGGLIVIFYIACAPFGVVLASVLEMTTGVFLASTAHPLNYILPCAIVSFGGLCVALQGFLFLKDLKMPFWFYLLYKTTHTICATAAVLVLGRIFL